MVLEFMKDLLEFSKVVAEKWTKEPKRNFVVAGCPSGWVVRSDLLLPISLPSADRGQGIEEKVSLLVDVWGRP